jgi:aspartate kinase
VSCTIASKDCDRAIAVLCQQFEVDSSPAPTNAIAPNCPPVRGVALDLKQARLAIRHIPDRPGMAAHIFQTLATANICVDMIIQSQRSRFNNGQMTRDIAFTVPQMDMDAALKLLKEISQSLGDAEVTANLDVAKVSIVGIGMLGRPGVAAQMFEALAAKGINIQMIATSEIRVSCVVAEDQGAEALQAVHKVFELGQTHQIEIPAY